MAVRTTATLVGGLIEVATGADLDPFILTSNLLVTEKCAGALDSDGDAFYDSERLELIERWLAAHFYAMLNTQSQVEKAGPVSERFVTKVDLGLDQSVWGQNVKIIDTFGGLARIEVDNEAGKRRTVGVQWLGTDYE